MTRKSLPWAAGVYSDQELTLSSSRSMYTLTRIYPPQQKFTLTKGLPFTKGQKASVRVYSHPAFTLTRVCPLQQWFTNYSPRSREFRDKSTQKKKIQCWKNAPEFTQSHHHFLNSSGLQVRPSFHNHHQTNKQTIFKLYFLEGTRSSFFWSSFSSSKGVGG